MIHPAPADAYPPRVQADPAALLDGLTVEQQAAVVHGTGPLLVFAGPGAGKTRTITHRIAYLLATGGAAPGQVLAVTFTVAAAGEMRERLVAARSHGGLGLALDAVCGLTVATFHSVCARMLRTYAHRFGRGEDYTIYDQADVAKVIGHVLSDKERTTVQTYRAAGRHVASGEILTEISLAKNRLWFPDYYAQHSPHPLAALIAQVWGDVEEELRFSNAFDFDDLVVYGVRLLAHNPRLVAQYRARWPWMLVDEFQDTNYAQMALVSLLAGPHGNLTVVADDDQLIYSWRGAEAGNVLRFIDWFPAARSVTLTRNYRCRAEILTAAVRCVENNTARVPKALIAVRGPGGRVETPRFSDDVDEAEWLTGEVISALEAGLPAAEVLVVARTGFALRTLEQSLAGHGVAYRKLGDLGLFERSEVKDAVAYLSLLANPHDSQAFRRIAIAHLDGVGATTANRVIALSRDEESSDLLSVCAQPSRLGRVGEKAKHSLMQFGAEMRRVSDELRAGRSVGHSVVEALMIAGGIVRRYQHIRDTSEDAEARRDADQVLGDLRSLCQAAATFESQNPGTTLLAFLEHACGLDAAEVEAGRERITLATIHRSKGKEAQLVVLVGGEERLLPSWRSLEDGDPADLEEERRMFYVAATRAKDRLVITQAAQRGGRDTERPSRFLMEAGLPPTGSPRV